MYPKIKRIYLAWRASAGKPRIIVGEFKINASSALFRYIDDGVAKAKAEGFICYPEFPALDKCYDTNVVRILTQRINNPERADISEYYNFWKINPKEAVKPQAVVAKTGGTLPTDNFEFLVDYYGAKGVSIISELTGLSHAQLSSELLMEGDKLEWRKEKNNPYDSMAVAVYKGDMKIGYIKQVHNRLFHKKGSNRLKIKVEKVNRNGHINKAYLWIYSDME